MKEPKIRFKGFSGEWKNSPLKDFFTKVTKKNTKLECTAVFTNSAEYGIIDQRDYFDFDVANSNNIGGYFIVSPDDFVYNPRVSVTAPVGPISRNRLEYAGVMSPLYLVFKIDGINKDYLCHYYKTNKWHRFMKLSGNCGARFDRLSISDDVFVQMPLIYPTDSKEQMRISVFLDTLDAQISASTSRLASLKQMKAASLQAMFPQEGETMPKVRFKGFEGEWKKALLSECLAVSKEKNTDNMFDKDEVLSVSDDFGVCNQIELLGRSYAGKSVSNYGVLRRGYIVYTKSPLKSKPYGIIKANHGPSGIVSTLYAIYSPKKNVSPDFIEIYFDAPYRMNKYIHPLINKGAKNDMKVSSENALKGHIMLPSYAEQQSIASFFTSLDRQIALHAQRLEKLKQIKAACLDKMFV
uniref:restriction endonuclease subunit S n=1 Tax=Prevotella sp. TaxID=59823 RepID=UPI0040270862